MTHRRLPGAAALVALLAAPAAAQVPYSRLVEAAGEPESWLTYSGNYRSERFTRLDRITRGERVPTPAGVDPSDRNRRPGRGDPAGGGRRDVHRRAAEHDRGARRPHRAATLAARSGGSGRDAEHRFPADEPRGSRFWASRCSSAPSTPSSSRSTAPPAMFAGGFRSATTALEPRSPRRRSRWTAR